MIAAADPVSLFEEARKNTPNPFTLEPVIAAEEVWGGVMTNLPSLNQHVDQQVRQAIDEVRQKISSKVGIAIKGDRGTGKSHTIHRIWKQIEQEGIAVFSYLPPCNNPNQIDSHVRLNLCLDFARADSHGVTQWQRLATLAIASLKGTEYEEQFQECIDRHHDPEQLRKHILATVPKDEREEFINELVEAIRENHLELDFDFLKATLYTIFKAGQISQIALAWLKGEDHPHLRKVGLPVYSEEQQAARSIWTIQQICKLATLGSIAVVICFDQIDVYAPNLENGDGKAQVVAKCIDRIYFQCSNIVLLSCLINDTWREIEHMGSGIPDRIGQRAVNAKPPNADQLVELVQLRLHWFFQKNGLRIEEYPKLYPFSEDELRKVAVESAAARSFLQKWCAKKFMDFTPGSTGGLSRVSPPVVPSNTGRKDEFLDLYEQVLGKIRPKNTDDDRLAEIISLALEIAIDSSIDGVEIHDVISLYGSSSHDLHLAVLGYDSRHQKDVKIGVRVCETTTGATFNAVMKRLLAYEKHELTRGCLVRSTPIPLNWKKGKELESKLVNELGGEVVILKKEELKPLAAIERIYQQCQDYGFTEEEITSTVKELGWIGKNPLIREILSAPEQA